MSSIQSPSMHNHIRAVNETIAAMAGNAGAGLLSVAMQSNIPAILAFLGSVAYAGAQVWKSYIDRDKRHHDATEHRLEAENKRLRERLDRKGVGTDDTVDY